MLPFGGIHVRRTSIMLTVEGSESGLASEQVKEWNKMKDHQVDGTKIIRVALQCYYST